MTKVMSRIAVAVAMLLLSGAGGMSAQGPSATRVPNDSILRRQASADPDARQLVDMTERLVALAIDTNPTASNLTTFLHWNGVLISARNTLAEAQDLLKRTALVADREEQTGRPLLAAFRRAQTSSERLAACLRIYRGVDPEVFDITSQSCAERYAARGPFEQRWQARGSGLTLLKNAVAGTSVKELALERSLETAQDKLDDALRGKTSYTAILYVAAGLTFLMLVLLNFAKEDVRRLVFTNVHATELVTVVLVVLAVLFFGSIQALSGEAVSGLLGAIAGYVLGRQNLPRGGDASGTSTGAPPAPGPVV